MDNLNKTIHVGLFYTQASQRFDLESDSVGRFLCVCGEGERAGYKRVSETLCNCGHEKFVSDHNHQSYFNISIKSKLGAVH